MIPNDSWFYTVMAGNVRYFNLAFGTLARIISRNRIISSVLEKHRLGTIWNSAPVTNIKNAPETSRTSRKAVQLRSLEPVEPSICMPLSVTRYLKPLDLRGSRNVFAALIKEVTGTISRNTQESVNKGLTFSAKFVQRSSGGSKLLAWIKASPVRMKISNAISNMNLSLWREYLRNAE